MVGQVGAIDHATLLLAFELLLGEASLRSGLIVRGTLPVDENSLNALCIEGAKFQEGIGQRLPTQQA